MGDLLADLAHGFDAGKAALGVALGPDLADRIGVQRYHLEAAMAEAVRRGGEGDLDLLPGLEGARVENVAQGVDGLTGLAALDPGAGQHVAQGVAGADADMGFHRPGGAVLQFAVGALGHGSGRTFGLGVDEHGGAVVDDFDAVVAQVDERPRGEHRGDPGDADHGGGFKGTLDLGRDFGVNGRVRRIGVIEGLSQPKPAKARISAPGRDFSSCRNR